MRWRIVVVSKPPLSIEGRYAMTDTNVLHLSQPGTFADPLTEVLCNGARALLAQAVYGAATAQPSPDASRCSWVHQVRALRCAWAKSRTVSPLASWRSSARPSFVSR